MPKAPNRSYTWTHNPPRPSADEKLAVHKREDMIEILQACRCAYPVVKYRNRSGHSLDCPAHLRIMEQKEGYEDRRRTARSRT